MDSLLNITKKQIFPIGLILILALSRLIPHPPNFTPIIAVAIMSCYFFKNIYLSFAILIISMLLADFFIGFHVKMIFVYPSILIISYIFYKVNYEISFKNLFIFGFFGSVIFFIISNFGVWLIEDLYEYNMKGLIECYILALPFFKNTFISTVIFSYAAIYVCKKLIA